jgi:ABC-type transport system substrate-binding protein
MLKAGTPEKVDMEPIGTGPFKLAQYQKDSRILFTAFPEYWQGKAKSTVWCSALRRMPQCVSPSLKK